LAGSHPVLLDRQNDSAGNKTCPFAGVIVGTEIIFGPKASSHSVVIAVPLAVNEKYLIVFDDLAQDVEAKVPDWNCHRCGPMFPPFVFGRRKTSVIKMSYQKWNSCFVQIDDFPHCWRGFAVQNCPVASTIRDVNDSEIWSRNQFIEDGFWCSLVT